MTQETFVKTLTLPFKDLRKGDRLISPPEACYGEVRAMLDPLHGEQGIVIADRPNNREPIVLYFPLMTKAQINRTYPYFTPNELKDFLSQEHQKELHRRALIALFNFQTQKERSNESTTEHNGIGFDAVDAQILTSFTKQINRDRPLSWRQHSVCAQRLPKYAKQLHIHFYSKV